MNTKRTISDAKNELKKLTEHYYVCCHEKVRAAIGEVRQLNAPRIKELEAEIESFNKAKPATRARLGVNTPELVLKVCNKYWSGTTVFYSYRIHCWNKKAVWTSYPAGGYSNNSGWNPTPPSYHLLSLTLKEYNKPKRLKEIAPERNSGKRVTPKIMLAELNNL